MIYFSPSETDTSQVNQSNTISDAPSNQGLFKYCIPPTNLNNNWMTAVIDRSRHMTSWATRGETGLANAGVSLSKMDAPKVSFLFFWGILSQFSGQPFTLRIYING